MTNYQLPSGQLWWIVRFVDSNRVSEILFTYEHERQQTWYFANQRAQILLKEMGLENTKYSCELWVPPPALKIRGLITLGPEPDGSVRTVTVIGV